VSISRFPIAAVAIFLVASAHPALAFGQAWIPMKGEGSISTGFQAFHVHWHLERDGSRQEESNIQIRNVTADFTYGLTDRIAVSLGLPLVSSKFGELSHPCPEPVLSDTGAFLYIPCSFPESEIDKGSYYTAFQDFRASVRFGLWNRHITLTPSVGIVLPSHEYEIHGHAAPGRGLRTLDVGLHVGRSLGPRLPNTYAHASYVFAVSQRVKHHELDLSLNRSNAEVEVGHQLAPRLAVHGFLAWQHTHGGLEWVDELFAPGSIHEEIHDQAAKASHRRAGFGMSYAVNGTVTINFSLLHTLAGKNSHQLDGVTLGTTWALGGGNDMVGGKKN